MSRSISGRHTESRRADTRRLVFVFLNVCAFSGKAESLYALDAQIRADHADVRLEQRLKSLVKVIGSRADHDAFVQLMGSSAARASTGSTSSRMRAVIRHTGVLFMGFLLVGSIFTGPRGAGG